MTMIVIIKLFEPLVASFEWANCYVHIRLKVAMKKKLHGGVKPTNVEKDCIVLDDLSNKDEFVCSWMLLIQ